MINIANHMTLGKYQILGCLGHGSFGTVYKAIDRVLNVESAIKVIEVSNPERVREMFQEAELPYKCEHNNIIKIKSGELIPCNDKVLFVIDMELVQGSSVEDILRDRYLSIPYALTIIKDILFAVEYAHAKGVIHRDIKPGNILLDDNGRAKLSDFGLAMILGSRNDDPNFYISHAAPELHKDLNAPPTIAMDIYALGMTLYRMVNSIHDWRQYLQQTPNYEQLLRDGIFVAQCGFRPFVPDVVKRIIHKACNPCPNKRFPNAKMMRDAIIKLHTGNNWQRQADNIWNVETDGVISKEISIEKKRDGYDVVVKHNRHRSNRDSKKYTNFDDATEYMYNYIKETTFK